MSHWLNPNLTEEECIHISKMKTAAFVELCDSASKHVDSIQDREAKIKYLNFVIPLLMQQMCYAML